jgi:hypothetical protein
MTLTIVWNNNGVINEVTIKLFPMYLYMKTEKNINSNILAKNRPILMIQTYINIRKLHRFQIYSLLLRYIWVKGRKSRSSFSRFNAKL